MDNKTRHHQRNITRLLSSSWFPILIFSAIAYIILAVFFNDYLYAAENHSLWLNSIHFLEEHMRQPGGLMMWAGCYLTQYLHYPYLGALMLVAIWALIYLLTIKAFRLQSSHHFLALIIPTALLSSEIDLGYWLYYIKLPGYWFTESIGVTLAIAAIWLFRLLKPWGRISWLILFCFLGYALLGWYALLATVGMIVTAFTPQNGEAKKRFDIHPLWILLSGAITAIATPLLWYQHYDTIRLDRIYLAAFPLFEANTTTSLLPSVPFIVIALTIICLPLMKKAKGLVISCCSTVLCAVMLYVFWFGDANYHTELRMMRALEHRDWNTIIQAANQQQGHPTRQIILLRNLALLQTGQLGEKMFTYDNETTAPATYDSLQVRMVRTVGPEIYLQYGKTNFSYRWCIENGVEYGMNVVHLRHLAKSSILNKELNLALKYINLLKRTTFHKKEAMKLEAMVFNPQALVANEEMTSVANLIDASDMLDTDNGVCDIYLTQYFSQVTSHNPVFADLITAYTLFVKNNELFWPRFMNYGILHEGQAIPRHYLEAAYLFGNLDNSPIFDDLQFDMAMVQNYSNFQLSIYNLKEKGYTEKEMAEEMKKNFGKTYWWYYYFATENKFY